MREEEAHTAEAMMHDGRKPESLFSLPISYVDNVSEMGGSLQLAPLTMSSLTKVILDYSGISITGRRCASGTTMRRRQRKTEDGDVDK